MFQAAPRIEWTARRVYPASRRTLTAVAAAPSVENLSIVVQGRRAAVREGRRPSRLIRYLLPTDALPLTRTSK